MYESLSRQQMTEGQPGREMYMLTSGELEVLEGVVGGDEAFASIFLQQAHSLQRSGLYDEWAFFPLKGIF